MPEVAEPLRLAGVDPADLHSLPHRNLGERRVDDEPHVGAVVDRQAHMLEGHRAGGGMPDMLYPRQPARYVSPPPPIPELGA